MVRLSGAGVDITGPARLLVSRCCLSVVFWHYTKQDTRDLKACCLPECNLWIRRHNALQREMWSCEPNQTITMAFHKHKLKFLTFLTILSLVTGEHWSVDQLSVSEDGGYGDIVIRISDSLDMNKCSQIINSLKVNISNGGCQNAGWKTLPRAK